MATLAAASVGAAKPREKTFKRDVEEAKTNVAALHGRSAVALSSAAGALSSAAGALSTTSSAAVAPMPSFESDPRVAQLYSIAKRWAKDPDSSVNAGTIITFVTTLIATVQQLFTEPHTGSYKSDVLVHVLTLVLENDVDWKGDETSKQTVLALMQFSIPNIIRTAIGVARGEIDLGKMWKNCFPCCFGAEAK